ncbi:hypothetical protein [Roseovarius salinarum]|uniref:hypothetical protein n=1 Tax=Roseovarius salinarum TaxID=1981892 RepID=UPI00130001EA|nr:hypothetical protein [Roseovarius salinarum]
MSPEAAQPNRVRMSSIPSVMIAAKSPAATVWPAVARPKARRKSRIRAVALRLLSAISATSGPVSPDISSNSTPFATAPTGLIRS